jgi:hypothetical protein
MVGVGRVVTVAMSAGVTVAAALTEAVGNPAVVTTVAGVTVGATTITGCAIATVAVMVAEATAAGTMSEAWGSVAVVVTELGLTDAAPLTVGPGRLTVTVTVAGVTVVPAASPSHIDLPGLAPGSSTSMLTDWLPCPPVVARLAAIRHSNRSLVAPVDGSHVPVVAVFSPVPVNADSAWTRVSKSDVSPALTRAKWPADPPKVSRP